MRRQRFATACSAGNERLRRDSRPTSIDTNFIAALWLEQDVRRMCERGTYLPDFSTPVSAEVADEDRHKQNLFEALRSTK
jgi:hypothetical protein